jgi:serine/threonine-protein kinase RsbW
MTVDKVHSLEKEKILKMEILPEFSEITRLTHLLRDFFYKHGFPISHANEICLVIEELTVNTIMHGYKNIAVQDREKISIEVDCDAGKKVSILFKDAGISFDPTIPRPPREEGTIGGWGLMLIKKTMHDFRYERSGKYNILNLFKRYK